MRIGQQVIVLVLLICVSAALLYYKNRQVASDNPPRPLSEKVSQSSEDNTSIVDQMTPRGLTDEQRTGVLAETDRLLKLSDSFTQTEKRTVDIISKLNPGNISDSFREAINNDQDTSDIYWALLGPTAPEDLTELRYRSDLIREHEPMLKEIQTEVANEVTPKSFETLSRKLRDIAGSVDNAWAYIDRSYDLLSYAYYKTQNGPDYAPPPDFAAFKEARLRAWQKYLADRAKGQAATFYRGPQAIEVFWDLIQPPSRRDAPGGSGLNTNAFSLKQLGDVYIGYFRGVSLHSNDKITPPVLIYAGMNLDKARIEEMKANYAALRDKHGEELVPDLQTLFQRVVQALGPEWFLSDQDLNYIQQLNAALPNRHPRRAPSIPAQRRGFNDFKKVIQWASLPGRPDHGTPPTGIDADKVTATFFDLAKVEQQLLSDQDAREAARIANARYPVGTTFTFKLTMDTYFNLQHPPKRSEYKKTVKFTVAEWFSDEHFVLRLFGEDDVAARPSTQAAQYGGGGGGYYGASYEQGPSIRGEVIVHQNNYFSFSYPGAAETGTLTIQGTLSERPTGKYNDDIGRGTFTATIRKANNTDLFVVGARLTLTPSNVVYTIDSVASDIGTFLASRKGKTEKTTFRYSKSTGLSWKDAGHEFAFPELKSNERSHTGKVLDGDKEIRQVTVTVEPPQ